MNFLHFTRPLPPIEPEIIFRIFGYPIASSTLYAFALLVVFGLGAWFVVRKFTKGSPKGFQNGVETIYEAIVGFVTETVGSRKHAERILPLVATLFVYIAALNLFNLIPGLTSITYEGHEVLHTSTTDFNTTFALALGSVIMLQILSIMDWGLFGHLGRFIKFHEIIHGFKQGIGSGINGLIEFAVGILELIGEVARIISLSFRLFGNIYAHEVLTVVIFGALAYVLPAVWTTLGLLVSLVQAVVFGFLITVYYSLSIKSEEANHH